MFLIDSGPPEVAGGSELQVRQLADGREFTIVKRFWQPDELAERVAELGFGLDLRLTGNELFLHGGSV